VTAALLFDAKTLNRPVFQITMAAHYRGHDSRASASDIGIIG
jgi:hypothetical protein